MLKNNIYSWQELVKLLLWHLGLFILSISLPTSLLPFFSCSKLFWIKWDYLHPFQMASLAFLETVGLKVMTEGSGEMWMWAESTRGKTGEAKGRTLGCQEAREQAGKGRGFKLIMPECPGSAAVRRGTQEHCRRLADIHSFTDALT